jgi:hypothetical protein
MGGQSATLDDDMSKLKLSEPREHKTKPTRPKRPAPVADSWEDDLAGSSSSEADEPEANEAAPSSSAWQPSSADREAAEDPYAPPVGSERDSSVPTKRPEKSTATIRRMLAGSLGLKIRPSEETKKFEKAQVANERKRREDEKARVEQEKEAKRSVWED